MAATPPQTLQSPHTWDHEIIFIFPEAYEMTHMAYDHSGYGAIMCRHRSDGVVFYVCNGLKNSFSRLPYAHQTFDRMLEEEVTTPPMTREEFIADVERERVRLKGFYL